MEDGDEWRKRWRGPAQAVSGGEEDVRNGEQSFKKSMVVGSVDNSLVDPLPKSKTGKHRSVGTAFSLHFTFFFLVERVLLFYRPV